MQLSFGILTDLLAIVGIGAASQSFRLGQRYMSNSKQVCRHALTIKIRHWVGRTLSARINPITDNVLVEITFAGLDER
jgi:hypothetical protein